MDNTFKNSSNFKENKLFSIILENKLYIIAYYKIIIYFHASRESTTSYNKSEINFTQGQF